MLFMYNESEQKYRCKPFRLIKRHIGDMGSNKKKKVKT